MGQCAIKTPLIDLLHYQIQNEDEIRISIQDDPSTPDTPSVADDTTDKQRIENERRRIIYERQLSKEINDNYIRKTRKEILFPLILSAFPDLSIPMELLNLILDFEQDDSLAEIFKMFNGIKTSIICNVYPIPYLLGWIQMVIFAYLSSEHWSQINENDQHLQLLQLFGIILCAVSIIQMIGCYFCIKLNVKPQYCNKLVNLKSSFLLNDFHHRYDCFDHMKAEDQSISEGWELFIPFQKWTNCLRVQNLHNVRNQKCEPRYIIAFYCVKPIFCLILGIQLVTLSPHCLALWLLFFLFFSIFLNICVFNKSPMGSYIGCTIFMMIICATSIQIWPQNFESGLLIAFEIFVFLIFLLYLFSLYLICCSGRVNSNGASANMLGVWLLLFTCYCLWITELMERPNGINYTLMFSLYLLYIAFQMLLLTSCDLQTEGINCFHQIQFIFVAILFGWLCDLDVLMKVLFCREQSSGRRRRGEEDEGLDVPLPINQA